MAATVVGASRATFIEAIDGIALAGYFARLAALTLFVLGPAE